MTWPTIRTAISDLLGALTVTEPSALTVRRVFEFPPAAVEPGDLPCFIMLPPRREQQWGPSFARIRNYTMRIQFLAASDEVPEAVNIADAFSEAANDMLFPAFALHDVDPALTIDTGPQIDEPAGFVYGAQTFIGFEMAIDLQFDEAGLAFAR